MCRVGNIARFKIEDVYNEKWANLDELGVVSTIMDQPYFIRADGYLLLVRKQIEATQEEVEALALGAAGPDFMGNDSKHDKYGSSTHKLSTIPG